MGPPALRAARPINDNAGHGPGRAKQGRVEPNMGRVEQNMGQEEPGGSDAYAHWDTYSSRPDIPIPTIRYANILMQDS